MTSPAVTPAFGSSRPAAWAYRRPPTTESPRPGASTSPARTSTTAAIPSGCGCRWSISTRTRKSGSWAATTSWWTKTAANAMCGCRPTGTPPSSRRWPRGSRSRTPLWPFVGRRGLKPVATPWCPISRTCCSLSRSPGSAGSSPRFPEAAGRTLRSSRQLLPPHVQVRRAAAGAGTGAVARHSPSSDSRAGCIVFAAGRYAYAYCPTAVKRVLRRVLAGSQERDF